MYQCSYVIYFSPASIESPVGIGAVGRLDSPQASAEIDGEESEVVCIDTPIQPQCDLISLLREVTPFPIHLESNTDTKLSFVEIFLSVEEEDSSVHVPQHVRELLVEYQYQNPDLSTKSATGTDEGKTIETDSEKYEKGIPLHGDKMFHNFVSQIQKNPGQLLRYKYTCEIMNDIFHIFITFLILCHALGIPVIIPRRYYCILLADALENVDIVAVR